MTIRTAKEIFANLLIERFFAAVDSNPSLRGYLQGYIAEIYLEEVLLDLPGISEVRKIPDRENLPGDFQFTYKGQSYTIELKSCSSSKTKDDLIEGHFAKISMKLSDSRKVGDTSTTCISRGSFDILAVSTFSSTGTWEFFFADSRSIPSSIKFPDRMKASITLSLQDPGNFTKNLIQLVDLMQKPVESAEDESFADEC